MNSTIKALLTISVAGLLAACSGNKTEQQAPNTDSTKTGDSTAHAAATYEYYGDSIGVDQAVKFDDFLAKAEAMPITDTLPTKFVGQVVESCANKGCWVSVKGTGEKSITVRFKGYKFFVPTSGIEGKELVAEGVGHYVTVPVEDLKKEAKEDGKTAKEIAAITKPEHYLEFTASGVAIKN